MSNVVDYPRHKPNARYAPDWWQNKPTTDAFLDIEIPIPPGYKLETRRTLTYVEQKDGVAVIRLYARKIVVDDETKRREK